MGGPTVNLIITPSLSKQYKEKQPFTVFQTALQNTLILSYLYQCDRIIPQQRINREIDLDHRLDTKKKLIRIFPFICIGRGMHSLSGLALLIFMSIIMNNKC